MKVRLDIQSVAVKQLESAIWMFAYNYDEVAVHTIAGAAFELYTKRLGYSNFKADVEKYVKPEKSKDFFKNWNLTYNYFKHGEHQNKPIETLDYNEESVELLIFYATEGNLLGPEEFRLNCAQVFRFYFFIKHPEIFEKDVYEKVFKKPMEERNISLDVATDKETLRVWLDTIGHTFVNGTDSPYRDIVKKAR